jgi:peroxiredoxin
MKYILLFISLAFTQVHIAQTYPETLPEFEIFSLNGETFNQDQVKKGGYSYFIYYNPTCGHCVKAFKLLNLKSNQIKDTAVEIYTISANTVDLTEQFFEDNAPRLRELDNVHILRDDDYHFADTFGVGPFPSAYLYDEDFKLVKVLEGTAEVVLFINDLP